MITTDDLMGGAVQMQANAEKFKTLFLEAFNGATTTDDPMEVRSIQMAGGIGHIMAGVTLMLDASTQMPDEIKEAIITRLVTQATSLTIAQVKKEAAGKPDEPCDCPRCQATREAEAKEAERVRAADEQAAKWAAEEAEGKGNA